MADVYELTVPRFEDMTKDQQRASEYAWSSGKLDFLILPHQLPLWSIICHHMGLETDVPLPDTHKHILNRTSSRKPLVIEVARRFGKSSLVMLALLALCIKNKDRIYYFCAQSEGAAKNFVLDVFKNIIRSCPPKLRPRFVHERFEFHTGSKIKVGGLFNGAEGLRGDASHGSVIDEAGAIPKIDPTSCLTYVLSSILQPQLMTTRGWCVMLTTPPANMSHDYHGMATRAQEEGRFIRMDIYQCTAFTPEEIEEMKQESYSADPSGSSWSREYLCKAVADPGALIVHDTIQERLAANVRKYPRPQSFEHLHRYVSMDHGTVDFNATLFGYWDFLEAKLIVEKELAITGGPTTKKIAEQFVAARKELWGNLKIERAVCDSISQQVRIDLNDELKTMYKIKEKDLYFLPPKKSTLVTEPTSAGEREGMTNKLLNAFTNGQIIIDPECKLLLETIRTATWKESKGKREFGRNDTIGHCDMLAALMYMWMIVLRNVNPLVGVNAPDPRTHFVIQPEQPQTPARIFQRALNKTGRTVSILELLRNRR